MIQQTQQDQVRRFVGVASTVAGLICYAFSSSFNNLFGKWSLFKIFAYIVFSSIICLATLFPKVWQHLRILPHYRAHFAFLVLISTTVYSFYLDRKSKTKPDAYGLISSVAFATTSLFMSKQIECGFLDLMYFFCGRLVVQLMEIEPLLAFVGIGFTYFVVILRSCLDAPPPRSWSYDVFLSFNEEDSRHRFTGHLTAALERRGIKAFISDKDLEIGEAISSMLLEAIEESMFAIVVLSPKYAFSSWCLDELHKILECSKNMGLDVVPVFYDMDPSDVEYQKGRFGQAFKKHEQRLGPNSEKIKRWRDALTEVASLPGWHNSKDEYEGTLVDRIAEHIHEKLIKKSSSSKKNL